MVDALRGKFFCDVTDSMIPEAFEHGGRATGLWLTLGFGIALQMTLAQLAT
jgi:hypothetical protein